MPNIWLLVPKTYLWRRDWTLQFDPLTFWIFLIFTNFLTKKVLSCSARCKETHILSSRYTIPFFLWQIKLELNHFMLKKLFDVSPRHVNRFSEYSFDCKTFFIFQLFSLLYYTLTGQTVKISIVTHANEAIANTWNLLKSYCVSSESVWKIFWSNEVLGR